MKESFTFSAPGRTEISGNHTDHQHGCVLAAAVNLETVAEVTLNGTDRICVRSEGYAPVEIDLKDLTTHEEIRCAELLHLLLNHLQFIRGHADNLHNIAVSHGDYRTTSFLLAEIFGEFLTGWFCSFARTEGLCAFSCF